MNLLDMVVMTVRDAVWSAIAAVGFAILFNVPKRALPGCIACAAAGHATRTLLMHMGVNIVPATLAGATLVGSLAVELAHLSGTPPPVFSIPGAIPLVPGVFAYQAMIGLVNVTTVDPAQGSAILVDASINAMKTALILGMIAVGIAAPTLLFRRRKPVV